MKFFYDNQPLSKTGSEAYRKIILNAKAEIPP